MRGFLAKLAVVVVRVMLAGLIAEGVYSALTGGSLLRLGIGVRGARVVEIDDAQRAAIGELTPGPFAVDVDPWVVSRMKASTAREIVGVTATTDDWGQRARPGPAPVDGGQRIVILGDSVAFGFGVADDHTYGHRLETMLREAVTTGPRPAVWTVACPGWSGVNAIRYLEGHLARLDPDLVVYLPTCNDLDDSGAITETGHRTLEFSPERSTSQPLMSRPGFFDRAAWMGVRLPKTTQLEIATAGASWWDVTRYALYSRLGPTSRERWSRLTDMIRGLAARLEARNARLAVAMRWDNAFLRDMELDLRAGGDRRVDVLPLLGEERPEDALENDSHPNPECILAGAIVMARRLVEDGLVERIDASRLPAQLEAYRDRERGALSVESLRAWRHDIRERNAEFTSDVIDVVDGHGFHQIYGGLDEDGWVGRAVSLLLPGPATTVTARVELPRAEAASFPLALIATFTGESGREVMPREQTPPLPAERAGETVDLRWEVPDSMRSDAFFDLRIQAPSWSIVRVGGRMRARSFRLSSLRVGR